MYVSTFSFLTRLSKPRQKSLHKSDYQTFSHYSRSQISKGNQKNTLITPHFLFSFKGQCTSENVQCVHSLALTLMASLFHRFLSWIPYGARTCYSQARWVPAWNHLHPQVLFTCSLYYSPPTSLFPVEVKLNLKQTEGTSQLERDDYKSMSVFAMSRSPNSLWETVIAKLLRSAGVQQNSMLNWKALKTKIK